MFNGVIWPDFTRLPEPAAPVLALVPLAELGQVVRAGAAAGRGPAGFAYRAGRRLCRLGRRPGRAGAWVFTGDTGPNPALWERLAAMKVQALVIETAFRDDEHELADISRHLCPGRLRDETCSCACRPTSTSPTSSRARSTR
jgi:hypothetical protein